MSESCSIAETALLVKWKPKLDGRCERWFFAYAKSSLNSLVHLCLWFEWKFYVLFEHKGLKLIFIIILNDRDMNNSNIRVQMRLIYYSHRLSTLNNLQS